MGGMNMRRCRDCGRILSDYEEEFCDTCFYFAGEQAKEDKKETCPYCGVELNGCYCEEDGYYYEEE